MKPFLAISLSVFLFAGCTFLDEDLNSIPETKISPPETAEITLQIDSSASSSKTLVVYGNRSIRFILDKNAFSRFDYSEIQFNDYKTVRTDTSNISFNYDYSNLEDGVYPLKLSVYYFQKDLSIGGKYDLTRQTKEYNLTLLVQNKVDFTPNFFPVEFDSGEVTIRWNSYKKENFIKTEIRDNNNMKITFTDPTDTMITDERFSGSNTYYITFYCGISKKEEVLTVTDDTEFSILSAKPLEGLLMELNWQRYRHFKNSYSILIQQSQDNIKWTDIIQVNNQKNSFVFPVGVKGSHYRVCYLLKNSTSIKFTSLPSEVVSLGYEKNLIDPNYLYWLPDAKKTLSTYYLEGSILIDENGLKQVEPSQFYILSTTRSMIIRYNFRENNLEVVDPVTLNPQQTVNCSGFLPKIWIQTSGLLTDNGKLFLNSDNDVLSTNYADWGHSVWQVSSSSINFLVKLGKDDSPQTINLPNYRVIDASIDGSVWSYYNYGGNWFTLNNTNNIVPGELGSNTRCSSVKPLEQGRDPATGDTFESGSTIINGLQLTQIFLYPGGDPSRVVSFYIFPGNFKIINHVLYTLGQEIKLP